MTARRAVALLVLAIVVIIGYAAWDRWGGDVLGAPGGSAPPAPSESAPTTDAGIPDEATPAIVEYVHDGDTLFLVDGRKVRLLGINTPEIGEHHECYGDEATGLLRSLLPEGAPVWVLADVEPYDQYGRSLLFVYTDAGTNVNLDLLAEGAATVEQYSPNLLLQSELHAAEDSARSAGLGLWSACR